MAPDVAGFGSRWYQKLLGHPFVYDRLRPAWAAAVALPADRPPTMADLRRLLEANARIVWDYRFYYRELPELMRRDPELAAEYRAVRRHGLANVEALLSSLVAAGLLQPPDDPAALRSALGA